MSGYRTLSQITIPTMNIYLGTSFFHDLSSRPRRLHKHPCYELVCVDEGDEMHFTITPPLYEHLAANALPGAVTSFLFSFTDEQSNDICTSLKQLSEPITVNDTFGAADNVRSIRSIISDTDPGAKEQIAAELRLLFVKLSRSLYSSLTAAETSTESTLDEKRMAILEEYFNIRLKDPNCSKLGLADELGVCERQLSRILHDVYGKNFHAILLESRMTIAQAMFYQGRSAAETAKAVGYASLYSFKRAYKRYFGHSFGEE